MTPPLSLLITPPPLTQSRCIGTPPLPEQIELHRDRMWRRDEDLRVESALAAERFIEDVGFAKLRSLTPALSQWERGPAYADRCSSRRSIVPTSRCAVGGMLVCPAQFRKGGRRTKRRALPGTSRTKSCAAAAVYQEIFTQFARQSCPNGAQQAPCAPCSLLPAETFCPHGLQTDQNRSGR